MSEGFIGDPWRAVCPNGHRSWRNRTGGRATDGDGDGGFYCRQCGRFDRIHDAAKVDQPDNPMAD